MDGLSSISAIGWAHFKLGGGWRGTLVLTALYVLAICGAVTFSSYDAATGHLNARMLNGWSGILAALQTLIVLGFGAQRITAAVRRDITTNILESHRLMPISPVHAVIGYITGPTVLVLAVAAANVLLMMTIAILAGRPPSDVLAANVIIGGCVLFLWPAVTVWSFVARFALGVVITLCVMYMMTQGELGMVLPGLALLISPLAHPGIFGFLGRAVTAITPWHVVSLIFQLTFGLIFFAAAARRYARSDRPAFGPTLGIFLVILSAQCAIVGSVYLSHFTMRDFSPPPTPDPIAIVPTLVLLLLLMLLPLSAIARADHDAPPLWLGLITVAGFAAVVAAVAWVYFAHVRTPNFLPNLEPRVVLTVLCALAFLTTMYFLLRILYRLPPIKTTIPALGFLWLFGTWVGPLLADVFRHILFTPDATNVMTVISSASPLGALIQIWLVRNNDFINNANGTASWALIIGLAVQFALAALMVLAATMRRRPAARPLPA